MDVLRTNVHCYGKVRIECLAIVSLILVLMAMAIPNFFVKARTSPCPSSCQAHLKKVAGAKKAWALDREKHPFAIPRHQDIFGTDKYLLEFEPCLSGGVFTMGTVDENPTCSIAKHNIPDH